MGKPPRGSIARMGSSVRFWCPGQPVEGLCDDDLLSAAFEYAGDALQLICNVAHDHFNYIPANKLVEKIFRLGCIDPMNIETAVFRSLEEEYRYEDEREDGRIWWHAAIASYCDDQNQLAELNTIMTEVYRRGLKPKDPINE